MRVQIGTAVRRTGLALGVVLAAACPAAAQDNSSVTDYRLPDPSRTARPSVQGPVDPDNPIVAPTSSAPAPTIAPTITPSPQPRATLPAPRVSATPPTPARAPERETPAASPTARKSDVPQPPAAPATLGPAIEAPGADSPVPTAGPVAPTASPPSPEAVATAPTAAPTPVDRTPWFIGIAILLVGLAAWGALHRRRRAAALAGDNHPDSRSTQTDVASPAVSPAPQPEAVPLPPPPLAPERPRHPATPRSAPAPTPAIKQAPVTPSEADSLPLEIVFTPRAVRLSLVFATLQYELSVAHLGGPALQDLQVRADLAAAHASLSTRAQLAPDPAMLEAKHEITSLAPGETAHLKGEVRVPLQGLPTLNKGSARFFVPLVRFCLVGPGGHATRRVFTVGPQGPDGGIASVRLDAGPRNLRELVSREIEAARGLALDPAGAHG